MTPKISVVVTFYNNGNKLKECLESIAGSTFRDFELIGVDDCSTDKSYLVATKFCSQVIRLQSHKGRVVARSRGTKAASAEIVVNIDSDVVVAGGTLKTVSGFFKNHPNIDAITGLLSKTNPFDNFSSQYKNLYMHFHFMKLPKEVTFLYGSIYAYRKRNSGLLKGGLVKVADDTESGQALNEKKHKIVLLKNLKVVHLKEYDLKGLLTNDFKIPFDWAQIFWKYKGWKQLGRNNTGFAHASKEQLISLLVASAFAPTVFMGKSIFLVVFVFWFFLNADFHLFMLREKGVWFAFRAVIFTWIDNVVMSIGVVIGSISFFFDKH